MKDHKSPLVAEYADVSSIHGIRYILDRESHWCDRIIWLLVVSVTTSLAIFASVSIYKSWKDSPVLITIGTSEKPIADLEFPVITICGSGNKHCSGCQSNECLSKFLGVIKLLRVLSN